MGVTCRCVVGMRSHYTWCWPVATTQEHIFPLKNVICKESESDSVHPHIHGNANEDTHTHLCLSKSKQPKEDNDPMGAGDVWYAMPSANAEAFVICAASRTAKDHILAMLTYIRHTDITQTCY